MLTQTPHTEHEERGSGSCRSIGNCGGCKNTTNFLGALPFTVGKTEGKRPIGRPRITWEDSINTDIKDIC
jgi:hypothetical protein